MHVLFSRKVFAASASLLLLANCSVLYDLSPDQCGSNSECGHFGPNYRCNDGLCVALPSGGKAGTAGVSGRAGGGTSGETNEGGGGTSGEGNAGTAAVSGSNAGMGGMVEPDECTVNRNCLDLYGDADPTVCRRGKCEKLFSAECSQALPVTNEEWLDHLYPQKSAPEPFIYGAFVPKTVGTQLNEFTYSYELAIREFNAVGLPAPGGRRRLVMVLCPSKYDSEEELDVPLSHLVDTLQVPAIAASLPTEQLQHVIETKAIENSVFVISPLDSDRTLASIEDADLAWHLLPGADYIAVTYKPLFERALSYLRRTGALGMTEDVKVALASVDDSRYLSEAADTIYSTIRFNGDRTAAQNIPDHFAAFPYVPAGNELYLETINGLVSFAPHVIFGMGRDEFFSKIVPGIEARWDTANPGRDRPFYLLSPLQFNDPALLSLIEDDSSLHERMVGVTAASAADVTLYNSYWERLIGTFNTALPHYENYYDLPYHLFHATAAAGTSSALTGADIARGMKVIVVPNGTDFRVHPDDIGGVFNALRAINPKIALEGTMGPPNFDIAKGARADAGSVYCVRANGTQVPDALRYQDADTLTGTFPNASCFAFDP